jgi:hypothetical protein
MTTAHYEIGPDRLVWTPGTDPVVCPRCGQTVVFEQTAKLSPTRERMGICAGTCRMWHLRALEARDDDLRSAAEGPAGHH